MERWSYKPEVEGLSPSLGTNSSFASYRGVTHPGRTVTVRDRGVRRGASASRPVHIFLNGGGSLNGGVALTGRAAVL